MVGAFSTTSLGIFQGRGETTYISSGGSGIVDVWQDVSPQWNGSLPAGNPTLVVSMAGFTSVNVLGAGNDSLVIDFSHGTPLPGGLTFTPGSGTNTLTLVGTSGNDSLVIEPGKITYNKNIQISFSASSVMLRPLAGSDSLIMNSGAGTVHIPAGPSAGGGIHAQHFSNLSIASGDELVVATPAAHSDRTLMVIDPSGTLSVSGTLDLKRERYGSQEWRYGRQFGHDHRLDCIRLQCTRWLLERHRH